MKRVAYLVVCGAPPAGSIAELIQLLQHDEWEIHLMPTTAALEWLDIEALQHQTGNQVGIEGRKPGEPKRLSEPDVIVVAPATFNTINKWASGINDTTTLGVLNAALSGAVPIIASPYAKQALAAHPAFSKSLDVLRQCGVHLTETEALRADDLSDPYEWSAVIGLLREVAGHETDP